MVQQIKQFFFRVVQIEASLKLDNFSLQAYEEAAQFDPTNFSEDTKRQLLAVGAPQLPEDKQEELTRVYMD